jgi:hypothetical protein
MFVCLYLYPSVCDSDGCLPPPSPNVLLFFPRLLTFLEEIESLLRRGEFCLSFSCKLMPARYLCIKLLPALPSTVTLDFGPRRTHDKYFLSHNSLYNFAADRIGITTSYNSSFYTDGILNTYHRNVVCLLLGSGPTMGWSFLWGPF